MKKLRLARILGVMLAGWLCCCIFKIMNSMMTESHIERDTISGNIGGKPNDLHSDILPLDVVYTWVNGSDSALIKKIKDFVNKNKDVENCILRDCFLADIYAIETSIFTNKSSSGIEIEVIAILNNFYGTSSRHLILAKMNMPHSTLAYKIKEIFGKDASWKRAYWTSEFDESIVYPMENTVMLRFASSVDAHDGLMRMGSDIYNEQLKKCNVIQNYNLIVVECLTKDQILNIKNKIQKYINQNNQEYPRVLHANLMHCPKQWKREFNMNRFIFNDELRYSLRSLEKYAPWVRNVFIVTNGQVPDWLNCSNPRISIVTHKQIFPDQSHLPTFSALAIETHIHRIPGLSQHFLFFNDDFLLGAPAYPEDFYSEKLGYKIYFNPSKPPCSPGCLEGKIQNGICNSQCNTFACLRDGADCLPNIEKYHSLNTISKFKEPAYKMDSGCLDKYLGNSICDKVCLTDSSGYDAGDCGVNILKIELLEILPKIQDSHITMPKGSMAAWMNLTLHYDGQITNLYQTHYPTSNVRAVSCHNNSFVVWVLQQNCVGSFTLQLDITMSTKHKTFESKTVKLMIHYDTRFLNSSNINNQSRTESFKQILNVTIGIIDERLNHIRKHIEFQKSPKEKFSTSNGDLYTFYGSQAFMARLYRATFGIKPRQHVSHMPYLFNKTLKQHHQDIFAHEYYVTSSHKLREVNDMQLPFAYYNYIDSAKVNEKKHGKIIDTSRILSDVQLTDMLKKLANSFKNDDGTTEFKIFMNNCHENIIDRDFKDSDLAHTMVPLPKTIFDFCFSSYMTYRFDQKSEYKYTLPNTSKFSYISVSSDFTRVKKTMDAAFKAKKTFLVFNSDMTHKGTTNNQKVLDLVRDTFEKRFPIKSQFEISQSPLISYQKRSTYNPLRAEFVFLLSLELCLIVFIVFNITQLAHRLFINNYFKGSR